MPKDPRDLRKKFLEKRVEAGDESGVGLPRPEISDKYDRADVRGFCITDAMLLKYGFSKDCQGFENEKRALGEAKGVHTEECRLRLAMAADDIDRAVVEREVVRLQVKVDRHPVPEAGALPQPIGVSGGMDLPTDELHPAKHQEWC